VKKRVTPDFIALLRRKDIFAAFLLFAVALTLSIWFDGFERIAAFVERYEAWQLDELIVAQLFAPLTITLVAMRILGEAQHELQLRKSAEDKLNRMALHDPLTGLPNRRNAEQAIAEALRSAGEQPFALLVADLNRYRAVNDLHGPVTGDMLLLETGRRLQQAAGEDAFVGRLGSDEFIVLLPSPGRDDKAVAAVQAISQTFDAPFELGGLSLHVGASIGATLVRGQSADARTILTHASAAMARCKERGANGFAFFEPGMELSAMRRAEIEAELREAVVEGTIEPHYQPLVDLKSGDVIGYEVLARWRDRDGTLRSPGEFIAIAEETGLIGDLFFALLRTSMREVRRGPPHYRYAFNLSPRQLGEEWLVERILQVLVENGIAPGRIELEITESAIVDDAERVRGLIGRLKAQGIRVTLDDFGTGYSSLLHLSELDFDCLKIDRSFTRDLDRNPASQTIVRSVAALAHGLGLNVCAEGIETPACAEAVAEFGCDIGQGYLYGRPQRSVADQAPPPGRLWLASGGR
jgi:diguanylate cyclase (GGDEF)-like protein